MRFIDIHTHSVSPHQEVLSVLHCAPSEEVKALEAFSVGIHPWYITTHWEEEIALLEEKAQLPNCYAIGECGLDKLTDTPMNLQEAVFRKQIALSENIQKPLIIHCVKAFQEVYQLRKELKPQQAWVLHGFVKNEQLAQQMLSVGCTLSFGKALLDNLNLQRIFANLDATAMVLETDDAEVEIEDIYKKAAELRNENIESLAQQLWSNCKEVFKR